MGHYKESESLFDVSPYGCAFNQTRQHHSQACVDLTNTPFVLNCEFDTFGQFTLKKVMTSTEKMIDIHA